MTPKYIDHGYFRISRQTARSFGRLPGAGRESLVATDIIVTTHGFAWLTTTCHNGSAIWTLRDSGNWCLEDGRAMLRSEVR